MTRVKALQAIYFAAYGTSIPFFGLYYRDVLRTVGGEPSYAAVGTVFSVSMLVGIASPLIVGYLADKFRIHSRLISLLSLLVVIGAIGLYLPGSTVLSNAGLSLKFAIILTGAVVNGLFVRPLVPLIDTETLQLLRQRDGGIDRYGRVRVFGSLGWICTASVSGFIVAGVGDLSIMLIFYAVGFIILALVGTAGFSSEIHRVRIPWEHLRRDALFQRFLVFVFIISLGMTAGYVYTGVYMADLDFSIAIIGLTYALSAAPEIPVLLGGQNLLSKLGNRGMIAGGSFIQVAKFVLLFLIAGSRSPILFICVMLLQGAGYSLQFAGMIDFMDRRAHEHLRATYQSFYHIVFALGGAVGSFGGSLIVERYSSRMLMLISGLSIAAGVAYFLALVRPRPEPVKRQRDLLNLE